MAKSTPPPVSLRKLPAEPNLEQLKKQAKDLRRRHEAGDADAVAEVRRFFIPAADEAFKLSQAQLALARSYGFDSWPKLKAHVEGVTTDRLREAIEARDATALRAMFRRRPELANHCLIGELRPIQRAVMLGDRAMVEAIMEAGGDARVGIWPHREYTTGLQMAIDRERADIVEVIRAAEHERQQALSCPNTTIAPEQETLAEHTSIVLRVYAVTGASGADAGGQLS